MVDASPAKLIDLSLAPLGKILFHVFVQEYPLGEISGLREKRRVTTNIVANKVPERRDGIEADGPFRLLEGVVAPLEHRILLHRTPNLAGKS